MIVTSGEAEAIWQAQLLADQRDAVLKLLTDNDHGCDGAATCKWCLLSERIYDIVITDPRDAEAS